MNQTTQNTAALPTDDIFRYGLQWYLDSINVVDVWQDYTGKGVSVSVIDSAVDPNHPDLINSYDAQNSWDPATNTTLDPATPLTNAHGTGVAGLIAADRNGEGMVGVAYDSNIVSIPYDTNTAPVNAPVEFPTRIANAFAHAANFDISNNSWGFGNAFYRSPNSAFIDNFKNPLFQPAATELQNAVATGRNGLGTIFVASAGNTRQEGDDVNLHNFKNSRYNITVAATLQSGRVADYSSPGAALTVSAPSGLDAISTDISGSEGSTAGDYSFFNGTSGSAPLVSGVVALMLEANPNLGWRDVQEILVYSAVNSDPASQSWQTNGANNWNGGGLTFSHDFGAGLVDAQAAVRLAETWTTQKTSANEQSVNVTSTDTLLTIPDNDPNGISSTVNVASGLDIDYVEVDLNIDRNFIGDLEVTLTSPDGTVSTLINRPGQILNPGLDQQLLEILGLPNGINGSSQNDLDFVFGSTQHWGETGVGDWTLTVKDLKTGDLGRLNNWSLTLYGDSITADDTYIYTNELSRVGAEPNRQIINDLEGIDTINAAAVTSDSLIDLRSGQISTIATRNIQIASGTVIENAIAGDGADLIIGNAVANDLFGGRGNDTIDGGVGNDTITGSRGDDLLAGGDGADSFSFAKIDSIDTISDFNSQQLDKILVSASGFGGSLAIGTLAADAFHLGTAAVDALDRFIYDSTSGGLFFDVDGNGIEVQQQFATLSPGTALNATDIQIFA
ncbi:MAG: S8 family serine peptidase [Prochloraceae cyanobacterium]|nr:S8 family serine peptidase [Prochloraceae cyanobacterium]